MTVTTRGRGLSVAWASSGACSPSPTTYSSSRTAWKLNADAISSIMSKSSRWLIVTICPSSLNVNATISFAGTLRMLASSETVMNSVTRTSVFSRSFSSRRFSSWMSRKLGPSSRRCTPLRATGPLIEARVREMFCATASWSTSDFLPFLRFFPLSRRRSSSGPTPGAAEATGRGGAGGPPPGAALATGLGRTGVGITGRGGAPNEAAEGGGGLGRRAAAPHGPRLRRRRDRLGGGDLRHAAPLGRCGRFLELPLLALPPRAHQRHLLGLERRQVTTHKDVQLLEHAEQLLRGDAELRRQIVYPRRRHLPLQRRQPAGQSRVRHADRLHGWPAKPGAQQPGARSPHYRHPARAREALHLVPRAGARIGRQHDAPQSVPLQLGPHPRDPDHHPPGPEPE